MQLNKKHEVIKELVLGMYKAKFPKIKEEMDQMVDDWQYNISTPHWATLAPERKERQRVMIAPPYLLDRAKKIIRDLSPFKSDPAAAEIINYSKEALARLQNN